MLNKKYMFFLSVLILCLCISAVSAEDNITDIGDEIEVNEIDISAVGVKNTSTGEIEVNEMDISESVDDDISDEIEVNLIKKWEYNSGVVDINESIQINNISNSIVSTNDMGGYQLLIYKDNFYFHTTEKFRAQLLRYSNPVSGVLLKIDLNGKTYNRTTDSNGYIELSISGLNSDVYNTVVWYFTTSINYYRWDGTITIKPTITANDLTKYYKNSSQFNVKIVDSSGNLLKNTNVKFNINGVIYYRITNNNGIATLNINLEPGTYTITSTNTVTSENCANTIKVLPVLSANDLTVKQGVGGKFKVKLVDGSGNSYANQNITFNINGVIYTRTTDNDGIATLNINLSEIGEYIITSSYNGASISNKITVQ